MQSIVGPSLRMFYCVAELANGYMLPRCKKKETDLQLQSIHVHVHVFMLLQKKKEGYHLQLLKRRLSFGQDGRGSAMIVYHC